MKKRMFSLILAAALAAGSLAGATAVHAEEEVTLKWALWDISSTVYYEPLITAYEEAEKYIGRKADKNRKIYNGMMKTYFYQFMGPKPPRQEIRQKG